MVAVPVAAVLLAGRPAPGIVCQCATEEGALLCSEPAIQPETAQGKPPPREGLLLSHGAREASPPGTGPRPIHTRPAFIEGAAPAALGGVNVDERWVAEHPFARRALSAQVPCELPVGPAEISWLSAVTVTPRSPTM